MSSELFKRACPVLCGLALLVSPLAHAQEPSAAPAPEVAAAPPPPAPAPQPTAPKTVSPKPKAAAAAPSTSKAGAKESDEEEEVEEAPSELAKLLTDLQATAESLDEIRKKEAAAIGQEKELLAPQASQLESGFRRELVQAAESYVAFMAEPPKEEDEASDEEKEEKPAESDSAAKGKKEVSDEPSSTAAAEEKAARQAEAKELKTFVVKRLRAESGLVKKGIEADARSFQKALRDLNAVPPEEQAAVREKRNEAFFGQTRQLAEWNSILSALVSLEEKTEVETKAFKGLLVGAAQTAEAVLHTIADRLKKIQEQPKPEEGDDVKVQTLEGLRDRVASTQQENIELMDAYEIDTVKFKQALITTTGKMSKEVLDADVAKGLLKQWKDDATDWLRESASMLIFKGVSFLLIIFAFWLLARITEGLARRTLQRPDVQMSTLAVEFGVKMTGRVVFAIGIVLGASQLGIEVGPLLAGLGIAGFVLGFALQSTLSNFASGIMILMYRPFDVGHVIEAGGVMGTVRAMNLVSTTILTFDNQMLMVPNNKIWGDVIRNVTHQPERRVDLVFGIGYGDDIDHAERVLAAIVEENELVLKNPEPVIKLHELADSSVNFIVRPWVKTPDYWDAYWQLTREVKKRFDAEGLSIPFPQRDVHVHGVLPAAPVSSDSE